MLPSDYQNRYTVIYFAFSQDCKLSDCKPEYTAYNLTRLIEYCNMHNHSLINLEFLVLLTNFVSAVNASTRVKSCCFAWPIEIPMKETTHYFPLNLSNCLKLASYLNALLLTHGILWCIVKQINIFGYYNTQRDLVLN